MKPQYSDDEFAESVRGTKEDDPASQKFREAVQWLPSLAQASSERPDEFWTRQRAQIEKGEKIDCAELPIHCRHPQIRDNHIERPVLELVECRAHPAHDRADMTPARLAAQSLRHHLRVFWLILNNEHLGRGSLAGCVGGRRGGHSRDVSVGGGDG